MAERKRKHRRVPVAASATLTCHRSEGTLTTEAIVSNISLSGIGLYFDHPLEKGTRVSIKINFISTDGTMKTDSIGGEVVHTNKIENLFYAGIEFVKEIDETHQPSLFEHLQKILKWD